MAIVYSQEITNFNIHLTLSNMKKKILLLIGVMSIGLFVSAQTVDSKFAIGLYGGKNEYYGQLGNDIYNFSKAFYGFGGLSLATYASPSFDFGIFGNYGDYGYYVSNGPLNNFWGQKYEGTLYAHYKFNNGYIMKESAKLSPFIEVGVGLAGYSAGKLNGVSQADRINTSGIDAIVPVGIGLKYQLSRALAIQYKVLYNFTNEDKRDNIVVGVHTDAFVEQSFGIILSFGRTKAKDSDGDGVPDYRDKCPDTPKGVAVDANGCPIDSDGDGVPDYLDKCPDTPKGVAVDANGCPLDSDGDGVPDYLDKCPDTPKGVAVDANGCPFDTDGDGVPDYLDKCPNTPKGIAVDANGCPFDSDGDGVPDYLDKCPDTPKGVAVDANGCPEIAMETQKIFAEALNGIQFETGKDVITRNSYPVLDKVVGVMKENKSYKLIINGYTDNKGDKNMNQVLSHKRAEAVKRYLENKGIDPQKLIAHGYGEERPVADNSTAAGRAKNRRVEFKVEF